MKPQRWAPLYDLSLRGGSDGVRPIGALQVSPLGNEPSGHERSGVKDQVWIFSIRLWADDPRAQRRWAIVGPARASTVESALRLADLPEAVRAEIRADQTVRKFVNGMLDPETSGYHIQPAFPPALSWVVCIGSIQEVIA